jgi:signal transduction histidine kinase
MNTPQDSYPQLISLAVHELRTPASVVGGYLRMLQRDEGAPLNPRHQKMVDEAAKSCARIVSLIAELSDIGKMDAGLITMAERPLDLFELVDGVAAGMHEAADRGVRLQVTGVQSGSPVVGDAVRLQGTFHAIFRAILREMPDSSTVVAERRLATNDGRSSAVVVIADAASVHAAYDAPRGPFDEKRGGLGLLLPLARRVIEAHGGQIWAPGHADLDNPAARGAAIIVFPLAESTR